MPKSKAVADGEEFDLYAIHDGKPKKGVLDFERMFNDYRDANPKVWDHDRNVTLGASEAFQCIRQTWFKKHDAEKDANHEDSWGAMERGNVMEDHWVVPALRHHAKQIGADLDYEGDNQVTFVADQNSATPDGLVFNLPRNALEKYGIPDIKSDCVLVEIKSIDPRAGLDEEKSVHHGQAQIQMGILHQMGEFKPYYTVILYINASFYDDVTPFIVEYDPRIYKTARARAKQLFSTTDPAKLVAEGKLSDACRMCAYTHACAKASKQAVPDDDKISGISQETLDTLYQMVVQERAIDAKIKELKEEQAEVRQEIKDEMSPMNKRKAGDERFSISWIFQGGKKSLNKQAMIDDGIDIAAYETEGAGFEKMTITLKNK